ncbi:hypothetical protein [Nocardioides sp. LHG3406-4]|uniref:hypothetical protein n=1 Tax=Nocardioides sp. LHG3406-4 TaxID=2804575 RepID=UPI003CF02D73
MKIRAALALVPCLVALSACGGGDSDAGDDKPEGSAAESTKPASADVTVTLQDLGKLDALFHGNGPTCTTANLADAFDLAMENPKLSPKDLLELLPKTKVIVADESGTTLGLEELPATGGAFDKGSGCTWEVSFSGIDVSEFYKVTLEQGDFTTSTQVEGGAPTVEVDLTF